MSILSDNIPAVRGDKIILEERRDLTWNTSTLSHLPHTLQCENEVWRIVYLQKNTNRLPDAVNVTNVIKSHVPAMNALI